MRNILSIVRASRGLYRWNGITNNIGTHYILSVETATNCHDATYGYKFGTSITVRQASCESCATFYSSSGMLMLTGLT
jgi:hypothetical protein